MGELTDFLTQNEEGFRKARLPALYSDFGRLRTINPDGYAANVSAWRRALSSIVRSGLAPSSPASTTPSLLVLTADDSLLRALESSQYGQPLALGAVVREAALEGDLIPLPDFLKAKESIYHKSWWSSLPWNAVSWGLRQLGLAGGVSEKLPGGQFVVVANVEAAAKAFADKIAGADSRLERTWSAAHFKKTFAGTILAAQRLSDVDLDILLRFLSRDKGLILFDGQTARVRAPGEEATAITAEDQAMAQLKELTEYLGHQTDLLSRRVEELDAAAKDAVARGNRVAALAALKSKKLAESSLGKRFATLSQLDEVASKIEQAADQVQLVRVMASSTDALRELNAQAGGADRVEDVVERLREQMGAADEVGSILAEAASGSGAVVDEGEIDDELAALEREERDKAEAEARHAREAELARQAEETQRRLEAVEPLKPKEEDLANDKDRRNTPEAAVATGEEATEGMRKLSLEDMPQAA